MEGLRGTGSLAQAAVGAHGGLAGEGSSQGPLPTGWGDMDCFPSGAWCLWSTCEGRLCAMARAQQLDGRGVLPRRRLVPMEVLWGMAVPNSLTHQHGGRGVVLGRRSVLMECLWGTADPNGPGP